MPYCHVARILHQAGERLCLVIIYLVNCLYVTTIIQRLVWYLDGVFCWSKPAKTNIVSLDNTIVHVIPIIVTHLILTWTECLFTL